MPGAPLLTELYGQFDRLDDNGTTTTRCIYCVTDQLLVTQEIDAATLGAFVLAPDDKNLTIFADEVVIAGPIGFNPEKLLGAPKVTIIARKLSGVVSETQPACIDVSGRGSATPNVCPAAKNQPVRNGGNGASADCNYDSWGGDPTKTSATDGGAGDNSATVNSDAGRNGVDAGTITIVAGTIENCSFKASGGNGFAGQNGLGGGNGGNGGDGLLWSLHAIRGGTSGLLPAGSGGNGGNGAPGGQGGNGGNAGSISILSFETPTNTTTECNAGVGGLSGEPGKGGNPGAHGTLYGNSNQNQSKRREDESQYDSYRVQRPHDGQPGATPKRLQPGSGGKAGTITIAKVKDPQDPTEFSPFIDPTFASMLVQRVELELLAPAFSRFPESQVAVILNYYLAILKSVGLPSATTESIDVRKLQGSYQQLRVMASRAGQSLDFYGNRSSYAPHESFADLALELTSDLTAFAELEKDYHAARDAYNDTTNKEIALAVAYNMADAQVDAASKVLEEKRKSAADAYATILARNADFDSASADLAEAEAALKNAFNSFFSVGFNFDDIKSALEMVAFTAETPTAPIVGIGEGFNVLRNAEQTITSDDGKPVAKSSVIGSLATIDNLRGLAALYVDQQTNMLSFGPDYAKVLASAQDVEDMLATISKADGVANVQQALRSLLTTLNDRNNAVFTYNGYLQDIATLEAQIARFTQEKSDEIDKAAQRTSPLVSSSLALLAAIYQSRRSAVLEYLYLAQRAYFLATFVQYDVLAATRGGDPWTPSLVLTGITAATLQDKFATLRNQFDTYKHEITADQRTDFPDSTSNSHGLPLVLNDRDVAALARERRVRFTVVPTPAQGEPVGDGLYAVEQFAHWASIRLTSIRVDLSGATSPNAIISTFLLHGTSDTFVDTNGESITFTYKVPPPPRNCQTKAGLSPDDPSWFIAASKTDTDGPFSGMGPFTTWTLSVDRTVDLSALKSVAVFFRGSSLIGKGMPNARATQ